MNGNKRKLCTGSTVDFCSCKIDISAVHGGRMPRAHGCAGAAWFRLV